MIRWIFAVSQVLRTYVRNFYARNGRNVWSALPKRERWERFNFYVYWRPFIFCLSFTYTRKFYTRGHLIITRRWEIYPRTVLVSSGCIPLLEEGGWSFHVTSFLNIFLSLNIRYPMLTWQLNLSWKCHIKFINYLLYQNVYLEWSISLIPLPLRFFKVAYWGVPFENILFVLVNFLNFYWFNSFVNFAMVSD